jgi:glycosyltransferase involved in cell wall biosynthesis
MPVMNDAPRILHVISRLDGYGGAWLLRQLAKRHAGAGRAVAIAAINADAAIVRELTDRGATVRVLNARWLLDPVALVRLARWRRRLNVDVVHAWDASALGFASLSGRRETLIAAWEAAAERRCGTSTLAAVDVTALPTGTLPAEPSPLDRAAALAALGLATDARIIAVAGPLRRDRNLDEAIWNFELVRVLHPRARLVLLGDGPDRSRLERYAELVSEPGCVRFPGYRPDVLALSPHADVYWQEDSVHAAPHALLEAMAAGVPVIATDMPARRQLISHDVTGVLAPPRHRAEVARATDRLLSDRELARRLGAAAAEQVAKLHPLERSLTACEKLYSATHISCGMPSSS